MAFSVTGKLNKPASQFQAGESTGFGIRIGQQYYDRETKQKEWTNYECVIFAKQPQQIQYYQSVLVEGSIIAIGGDSQKIKSFDGQNGQQLSIEILNANLEYAFNPNGQQQNNNYGHQQSQGGYQHQAPQNQGGYQGSQQQSAPKQQSGGYAAPQQQGGSQSYNQHGQASTPNSYAPQQQQQGGFAPHQGGNHSPQQ